MYMSSHEKLSGLSTDNINTWNIDDSSFDSYVSMVHFREGTAQEQLERLLEVGKRAVGLDIAGGSNGRAITDMIAAGYLTGGVFTNFVDNRTDQTKHNPRLQFIDGDLVASTTWDKISRVQQQQSPGGFNVVLHRPYGGLQDLSSEQYLEGVQRVMALLRPGGAFYCQIPASPYTRPDERRLRDMHQAIKGMREVKRIEASVRSKTLSNHNFCMIYKRDDG